MAATPHRPRPAEDSSPRAILHAAEALFSEQGFDATSVNAIARRAQVSKANVFYHFGSKRELYLSVLRSACETSNRLLLAQATDSRTAYPQRLSEFAARHLGALLATPQSTWLVLRGLVEDTGQDAGALAGHVFGANFERLVGLIREGQQGGFIRAELDPALVALLLVGTDVFFFQTREVLRHFPSVDFAEDADRFSAMWWEVLWRGIAAESHPCQEHFQ